MAEGGMVWSVGRPPPTLPSQGLKAPCHALLPQWTLYSLPRPQQVRVAPRPSFPPAKQAHALQNGDSQKSICSDLLRRTAAVRLIAIALLFGGPLAVLKALISALPPDFSQRWRAFFEEHYQNEPLTNCRRERKSNIIYDVHGEIISTVGFTSSISLPVPGHQASPIPAFLWQAVVACEDRRFFQHHGVDPRGLARAVLSLSTNGGGSTITQQLVKNVFLKNERKWKRKLLEMFLALTLESRMSKYDILQAYLRKIYWGHGNYGVSAASEFYFGKHVSLLNIGECAMLAGMIPAPEIFSPFHDASRGKRAQGRALRRMVEVGFLDTNYAATILSKPLEFTKEGELRNQSPCKAPYFVDEVLKELHEKYGYSRVSEGGLKIYTTLDLGMQELAEKVVSERVVQIDRQQVCSIKLAIAQMEKKLEELQRTQSFVVKKVTSKIYSKDGYNHSDAMKLVEQSVAKIDNKFSSRKQALRVCIEKLQEELKIAVGARIEAALVAVDHSDGGVRVMIGGRDHSASNFNWSTQAYRPPGLAFKPVIFLTALAEKRNIMDILKDSPTPEANSCMQSLEKRGKQSHGLSKESYGSLYFKVGAEKVCRMGKILGVKTRLPCDQKLGLGDIKISPMQLATVYTTIAAGGICHMPLYITRVETADGQILEENKTLEGVRVVEECAVAELKKVLQVQQGVGQRTETRRRYCAEQMVPWDGHRDAWCAGFVKDITSVVWLGYDDCGCAGLHLHPGSAAPQAAQIWKHFMSLMDKDRSAKRTKRWRLHSMKNSKCLFKVHRNRTKSWNQAARGKEDGAHGRKIWKDVWDWDKASSVWDEREGLVEWTEQHLLRSAKANAFKRFWS